MQIPNDVDKVLPRVVERWARTEPDRPFLQQIDGACLTYAQSHEAALRWAQVFRRLGVQPDERVLAMRRPHIDAVTMWLGLGWAGAVETSINTDYRGEMLRYVIRNAAPRVIVVDAEFLPRVAEAGDALADDAIVIVPDADAFEIELPCRLMGRADAFSGAGAAAPEFAPEPWGTACVIYTSGTTGQSKGVLVPWAQLHASAVGCFPTEELGDDEAFYAPFATYHMSGKMPVATAASCGGRLVVRSVLSVSSFWDDLRDYRCTMTIMGGPFLDLVMERPHRPDDRSFPLRRLMLGAASGDIQAFAERFDVLVGTSFNMTEVSVPIRSGWGIRSTTSCGTLRTGYPGYEARIVDERDREVPVGEVGELVVRTSTPWTLSAGYLGDAEKTAQSWRNGWFHTGDAMRVDADGRYWFVDRIKDAIRRRGENISSFEVETAVMQHPDVAECAAVGVSDPSSGQEIKVCVLLRPGAQLAERDLHDFLAPRMPRFMVPRYIEFMTDLPRVSMSAKVRKAELRSQGITDATWDREAAGVAVPR